MWPSALVEVRRRFPSVTRLNSKKGVNQAGDGKRTGTFCLFDLADNAALAYDVTLVKCKLWWKEKMISVQKKKRQAR